MNATTYGLDIAKRVFQLYWVDAQTGEIANRKFGRDDLIAFLARRPAGRVALEACGSAHWWARKIRALGHEVVLLHAQFIRPFVQTNKTDAADARAIWTAVQQPGMRTVAAKTEDQQVMLSLHRMRSLLVKFRTMQINQLRGLLYEFGVTFRAGRVAGLDEIRERMAELEDTLPRSILLNLLEQLRRINLFEEDINQLEKRIGAWQKHEAACRAISEVPGIGRLTATALVATIGDAKTFRSGREFAAYLGLVPRQNGTGGKIRLGSISRRGDPYLRTLLIHGARSVLCHTKVPTAWQEAIQVRRPANVATVALANKMARIAWAILAHGTSYEAHHVSNRPA
ncbi:IS110 family transposase [Paraburkholderia terrae]|uniref:IS110 family transposase n=1 Tax=Paraburkholderia terrae TaxID=311230 RepID=A0A2I8F417_9BURK|nr:IS110 family transposase [Paraburkholderia terrae]AUT64966.1 IS110 family transposase [Paraburkholderia terrae]AUT66304.1 IS110 family transposase [Paraburkholderia terrae]AUT66450.1 IS110 family transposase [Paraburkholderia terrae]